MAQYFVTLDDNGVATGFYNDALHGQIPDGAVPITVEQWATWIGDTSGQRWDGEQLVPYERPTPPAQRFRIISSLSFRERLPPERRAAISVAAMQAAGAGDGTLLTFLLDQASATETNLDDARVQAGVAALRAADLITEAEANAMLESGAAEERP